MNDKLKHIIAGSLIAIVILLLFLLFVKTEMYNWDKGIAFLTIVIVGAGKEVLWDKWLGRGDPDFYDFFATLMGGWATVFAWGIVELIVRSIIKI